MGGRASNGRTAVERRSECELVVTRTFNGPVRLVFDAWTKPHDGLRLQETRRITRRVNG